MKKRIMEEFAGLNEACRNNPRVELSSIEDRGGYIQHDKQSNIYCKPKGFPADGFVGKFCR